MRNDEIAIRRHSVTYHVTRDHPCPERVRWQLDEIANGPLRDALSHVMSPLAKQDSDEIILIRRLEVDLDLDTSRDPGSLAMRWAARLAEMLVNAMTSDHSVPTVVRFPNTHVYLGRFLVDLAEGRAWSKWHYQRFRGLEALPTPVALRTAVLDAAETGLRALMTLSSDELRVVLRALGEIESRRIIEAFGEGSGKPCDDPVVDALVDVLPTWVSRGLSGDSPWATAVGLLVEVCGRIDASSWPAAARLAVALLSWTYDLDSAAGGTARASGEEGSIAGTLRAPFERSASGTSQPLGMHPIFQALSSAQQARLLKTLSGPQNIAKNTNNDLVLWTAFGGLVLLVSHLEALRLEAVWSDGGDQALVRLLLLAKCAGTQRASRVLADPALQLLVGAASDAIPGDWSQALTPLPPVLKVGGGGGQLSALSYLRLPASLGIAGDLECVLDVAAQQVLRAFARRLPGFADSSFQYLYTNFLDMDATLNVSGTRWQCRLGRPPLHALLHFTGTVRGSVTVPWLSGIVIDLMQGGG